MKKTITLFMALALVTSLFAVPQRPKHFVQGKSKVARMATMAEGTTFTFSSSADTLQTKDGITVKLAKGAGTNAPAWVDNSSHMRLYASNTITITGASLGSAQLTFSKQGKKDYADLTAGSGTLVSGGESTSADDQKTDSWTGSAATSVVFTMGSAGQRVIYSITVNGQGGGGGGDETEISGLSQAYAIYYEDEAYYWDFDLAVEFDEESVTYPELYFMCGDEASSKTSIVGTYAAYYAMAWKSAKDSIGTDDEEAVGTMTVSYVEEGIYNFVGSFKGTDGKTYTWNATNVEVIAMDADNEYEIIELKEDGGGETGGDIYQIDFTQGQGSWTIDDVDLPTGLTFVWKQNSSYGMKASAYNKGAYAAESWLISPKIDMTKATKATLKVNQAINLGASTNLSAKISTDGGNNWEKLSLNLPGGTSWDFQEDQVDLSAYIGETVNLAFVYVSTTSVCPSWEIKSVQIVGEGGSPTPTPSMDTISVAEAEDIASELDDNASTSKQYAVIGYASKAYEPSNNTQDIWMTDTKGAKGNFFAKRTTVTNGTIADDDYFCVVGKIEKNVYQDETRYQIYKGTATIMTPSALEKLFPTVAIKKMLKEGQVLLVKDGKLYNLMGQPVE